MAYQFGASLPAQKATVFNQAIQIRKILEEAERLNLQVLVRYSRDGKAVRAVFQTLNMAEGSLVLTSISSAGETALRSFDTVKVEFVLLSKKLYFIANVRMRGGGRLILGIPQQVVVIERRSNSRFKLPPKLASYVEFRSKKIDLQRFDAPYWPISHRELRNSWPTFRIDDVSLGGIACVTRYQAVADVFRSDETEELIAYVRCPGRPSIQAPVSVRWTKKISQVVNDGRFGTVRQVFEGIFRPVLGTNPLLLKEVSLRMGLQFSEVSTDLDSMLKELMSCIQMSDSI